MPHLLSLPLPQEGIVGEQAIVVVAAGAVEAAKGEVEVLGLASHSPRTSHLLLRLLKSRAFPQK